MAERPRPSTDQGSSHRLDHHLMERVIIHISAETAPLLRDNDAEQSGNQDPPSFAQRVSLIAQEPLTPLTRVLLVVVLIFLLLSSVSLGQILVCQAPESLWLLDIHRSICRSPIQVEFGETSSPWWRRWWRGTVASGYNNSDYHRRFDCDISHNLHCDIHHYINYHYTSYTSSNESSRRGAITIGL